MRLRARVSRVESGKNFFDGVERVMLKFAGASSHYSEIMVPNSWGLELDQELNVVVTVMGRPELVAEQEEANVIPK